ncbi:MAG: hypothetical protein H7226_09595 [Salinibacterium sp.]|nr:hypothetical protein [Salinibacterium sp.]
MTIMRHWIPRATALMASVVLVGGFAADPSAAASVSSGSVVVDAPGISAVTVGDDTVTVTGSVGITAQGATVDVDVLGPQSSADPAEARTFASVTPAADGAFTVSAPRTEADGTDNLYSQYLVTVDGTPIGSPHFADDLQLHPRNTSEYPVVADKKGLQVQMTDDAESLGVQHAGINVDLADIMRNARTSDDDIVFLSGGREYFFDPAAVSGLDIQIKALSDNGTLVNLIVLVYRHDSDPTSAANILIHPDASREPGAGPVFGFNTVTDEGIRYTTAAMEFIASRWSQPDEEFGKAVGFIVGNEVDAQWVWSNSGEKTLDQFLNDYSRALRIMSLASRNFDKNARTYTSLTHAWTVGAGANPDEAVPTRFYDAKDVIDKLNSISKATGDFPWFVAYHPYPADLFKPDFWNDRAAIDDVGTELITFKNIQVLPRYLAHEDLLYKGEPRRIILSEQGCNTPGAGDNLSLDAEKLQAACYAYAYYKVRFLPSIDSFILHRHVDHRVEGGLNLGLWAADHTVDSPSAPARQKYIYDVFKYIDTDRSLEVTDFAKEIIGIGDWADVIEGFDPAALDQRQNTTATGSTIDAKVTPGRSLGSFGSGADGWVASDNVSGVAARDGVLEVTGSADTYASQARGIVKKFGTDVPADGSWITTSLTLPSDTGLGSPTRARLTVTLSTGKIVEADALLPADGMHHAVAIELPREPEATVSKMKIRVLGTGSTQPASGFAVHSVQLVKNVGHSTLPNQLVLASTDSSEVVGSNLTLSITNLDAKRLHGVIHFPQACGTLRLEETELPMPRADVGTSGTVTGTVAAADGSANTLCITIGKHDYTVAVSVPPPTLNPVFDFEIGSQGWTAGSGVASVQRVTSFANGPGAPHGGLGALEATSKPILATDTRVISVTPTSPIDLSKAVNVQLSMNSYGGAPGATGYLTTVTLASADGTEVKKEFSTTPDTWNQLSIDVGSWAGRSAVSGITVTFAAVGSIYPTWGPRFQIDDLGYFTG